VGHAAGSRLRDGVLGAAARQIGHVTGAGLQSWTEAASGIEGVEGVGGAAVSDPGEEGESGQSDCPHLQRSGQVQGALRAQARGQFVLREHRIDGVDFPVPAAPRKALQTRGQGPGALRHLTWGARAEAQLAVQGVAPIRVGGPPLAPLRAVSRSSRGRGRVWGRRRWEGAEEEEPAASGGARGCAGAPDGVG